jgi:dienelactone hydrolase
MLFRSISAVFLVLLAAAVMFFAVACGSDDDDDSSDDAQTADDASDDTGDDTGDETFDPDTAFLNPEVPGPYLVGNTTVFLEDELRPLSCGDGHRRLVVEVWYPASTDAPQWPMNTFFDFFLDQFDAIQAGLERQGVEAPVGFENFPTGTFRDAPLNPVASPMPILFFSHGFRSNRFQNYTMAKYLASHGYVVVAPDHTCNAQFAPFPDGPIFFTWLDAPLSLFERTEDIKFLIDVFTEDPPEMFAGRLDPDRVGIWGHSFGGMTIMEVVKSDSRPKALLQLASFGFPPMPGDLELSSMFLYGYQDKVMAPFRGWHNKSVSQMPMPKYEGFFFDTGHFAFSDLCEYAFGEGRPGDGCGEGTRLETGEPFVNPGHEMMHHVLNPYATAFFGAALLQKDELAEYISANHFPKMIDYYAHTVIDDN